MSYKDWPENSPQRAFVEGMQFGSRWLWAKAERMAIDRYGPPVLDNDQPIDEEWLSSEGWEQRGECFDREDEEFPITIWKQMVLFEDVWRARIDRSDWPGPDLRTRGQLRALLAAIYGDS
jgi:hypothetical protein